MGLFPSANDFKAGKGVEKDAPRKTGIGRFFELVGRDMNSMFLANLLTCLGFVPVISLVYIGFLMNNLPVMLISAAVGGILAGPVLAGMYDTVLRALRAGRQSSGRSYNSVLVRRSVGVVQCVRQGFYRTHHRLRVAGKLLELQQHGLQCCGVQPVQCGGHLVYGGLLFGSHRGHDLSGRCVGIHGHIAGNGFVHRALNHACRIHLGGRALSRSGGLCNDGVHFVRCHFSAVHIGLQRVCQRGGNILRGFGCNALRRGRCCLRNGCVRSL